jgi:histone H1/5
VRISSPFNFIVYLANMSDTAPAPSPAKKAKATKKTAVKKPALHPKYGEMIAAAIAALKERNGSSRQAIGKYLKANYKVSDGSDTYLKQALRKGVLSGALKQVKGTGASGSFKLAEKPKKVAKKVTKKPAAKKAPKKKAAAKKAKKPAAKKPAAKKAATPKKKAPAKKVKKPVAKKPVAKKAAKKTPKKKAGKKGKK